MALKGLPPTLRESTRYVLCKVILNQSTTTVILEDVEQAIQKAVQHFVGVKGLAKAGVYVVKSHSKLPFVVIRCETTSLLDVTSSLQFIQQPFTIQTMRTSGLLSHVLAENVSAKDARSGVAKYSVKIR